MRALLFLFNAAVTTLQSLWCHC